MAAGFFCQNGKYQKQLQNIRRAIDEHVSDGDFTVHLKFRWEIGHFADNPKLYQAIQTAFAF